VFCCIGTTKAKTPDKNTYYKIDYGIPAVAAKLAKANGIANFIVVSAIGADKNSSIFYNRTKGQMEEAVLKENIASTHLLQPSLIVAKRKDSRVMEKLAAGFMQLLNPLLFGGAAKFKSIKASAIAKTMVWLANNSYPEVIVTSDKIAEIAEKYCIVFECSRFLSFRGVMVYIFIFFCLETKETKIQGSNFLCYKTESSAKRFELASLNQQIFLNA
jgi:hypothetical protein